MHRLLLGLLALSSAVADPHLLLDGAVRTEAPATWHLLSHAQEGPDDAIYFHYRVPSMDSVSKERVNIILRVRRLHAVADFRAFTDTVLGQVLQANAPVIADTLWATNSRSVLWRGQLRQTPYAILEKFALKDGVFIYCRAAIPLREDFSQAAQQTFASELDHFVASIQTQAGQVFPEGSGIGIHAF